MKYACPKCKSGLTIQKTFNHKIMISCDKCSLEDLLEYSKNIDETYLDFLTKFYKFQEDAIKEIAYGSNVVIEAPTASGKTEAFLIPVLQKINDKKDNHGKVLALFVYPTKALARDQYPKILEFAKRVGITVSVFDGDTKQSEREEILDNPPQLVI